MEQRRRRAIFPGTFDPITHGHLDLIERGLKIFPGVLVAVARSDRKETLFTLEERVEMVRQSTSAMKAVEVIGFEELLVDLAGKTDLHVIMRGLRVFSDFEYELQMALMNRRLSKDLEAVFLMPSEQFTYLTSTLVKEIFALGGDVGGLVPQPVDEMLAAKLGKNG